MREQKSLGVSQSMGSISLSIGKRASQSELLLAKARRLLTKGNDTYEDKDALYIMRLNAVLSTTIMELEQALISHKPNHAVPQQKSENPKKEYEEVQSEIDSNGEILNYYRKQLTELDAKRSHLIDSKYRQELHDEIIHIQSQLKDLAMFVSVNRERLKKKKKRDANPGPNDPKAPKTKNSVSVNVIKTKDTKVVVKEVQSKLDSSQVLVDKYEEVNVKDLELTDPKLMIEKGRRICEDLDQTVQRNYRLQDKLENIRLLQKKLESKYNKVNDRYEALRDYARDHQICEYPGMENAHKNLVQNIATMEKSIAVQKNAHDIRIKELRENLDQLTILCDTRGQTCQKLRQEIASLRSQIVEMKAIQSSLAMNEHLNLSSNVQRNNKILDYKGEHQDLQLSSTSFNQNQTIESLLRDGNHIEKRIANDYLENILGDIMNKYDYGISSQEQQRREKLAEELFESYIEISDPKEAAVLLELSIEAVLGKKKDVTDQIASQWIKEYDSTRTGHIQYEDFKEFIIWEIEDWMTKN